MTDAPKKCFVISPIGDDGSPVRKHADMTLNAIIKPALAEYDAAFHVTRGDKSPQIGMITNHVIVDIEESDLIVADLSFLNPNVFYELGFAHAAEKPVIHMVLRDTKLPFDNAGYRTIEFDPTDWNSHVAAQKQIVEQARSALAKGAKISNPITQARGWQKLKGSADSERTIMAGILQELAIMKRQLSELGDRAPKTSDAVAGIATESHFWRRMERLDGLLGRERPPFPPPNI